MERAQHTYRQQIDAPPERVFALLCPVRERDWLDGWDADIVHSESGLAEENCVFTTRNPDTVWTITRYHPEHLEMVRVSPGLVVVRLRIQLAAGADGTTSAEITYLYTALTTAGEGHIPSEEQYAATMRRWERSINHYLKTGEKLLDR